MTLPSQPTPSTHYDLRPSRIEGRKLGRYRLLCHLASGGMASIYLARAERGFGFERLVALKLMHPHLADDPTFVEMIKDEARMAARIRHPKVVGVFDIESDPEFGLYLVMEYVEGDHLGAVMRGARAARGGLSPRIAVRITLDLLEALEAAHGLTSEDGTPCPVIHRDVSPNNLLIGVDGVAKLTDFGVAHAGFRVSRTEAGQIKGKLAYMAPEQVQEGDVSERSDLFAVGVLLFEALTGERLFQSDSPATTLRKLLRDPVPRISSARPELAAFDAVIDKALMRDPRDRHRSAREMAAALRAAATDSCGIADADEVGALVRELLGDSLERRSERVRTAIATSSVDSEVSWIGEGRHPLDDVPTRPAAKTGARRERSGRVVQSKVPRIAALAGLAIFFAVAGVASSTGRNRPSTEAPRPAAIVRSPAAALPDGPPSLTEPLRLAVSPERGSVLPSIVLRVSVDAEGKATRAEPQVHREALRELERHAVAAVLGAAFKPAVRAGHPVAADVSLPVAFLPTSGPDHVIHIRGSDTIGGALGPALAAAFRAERPDVDVLVESLGSSTAFSGLLDGSADIGASSRPIRESEAADCAARGVTLEEHIIGFDGIAVVVAADSPLRSISLVDVAATFACDPPANVTAALGPVPWLVGRPEYSGTHAFFLERVLEPSGRSFCGAVHDQEHSADVVADVATRPAAIGYVGASYLDARVRALAIAAPGREPVELDASTLQSGSYPIYRPLLFYVKPPVSEAVRAFLTFAASEAGQAHVSAAGFVPQPGGAVVDDSTLPATRGVDTVVYTEPADLGARHEALRRLVSSAIERLRGNPTATVRLVGHAEVGEGIDAERDALRRAQRVREALIERGIEGRRISVETRGAREPVATNQTAEGRLRNRRVQLFFEEAR